VLLYSTTGGSAREHLATSLLINVVLVVALQLFIGNTGVISFGHVSFAAVGAYVTALLSAPALVKGTTIPDAPFGLAEVELGVLPAMILGIIAATLFAAVIGLAVTRLSGLGATIVTLALLIVTHALLTNWRSLTGGAEAFYGVPATTTRGIMLAVVPAVIVAARLFRDSPLGRRIQATREDELAAASSGVRVVRSRYVAWVLSAALTAVGGVLFAHFLGAINPEAFYFDLSFLILAMLILGGMTSTTGAVVGTIVVTAGEELTRYLGDGPELGSLQLPELFGLPQLFLGGVIVAVMILRPGGLVGDHEIEDLLGWIQARIRKQAAPEEPPTAFAGIGVEAVHVNSEGGATGLTGPARDAPASGASTVAPTAVQLVVAGVSKFFQGLVALKDVSVEVGSGEIVGLIGPNGAGKTTLINVISGILPADEGRISLNGDDITSLKADKLARLGIARTFQNVRLFGGLSVHANADVPASVIARRRPGARRDVDPILEEFGLTEVCGRKADTLPYGRQRAVEMARAMALDPVLLLLDEPAAGMNEQESEWLLRVIRLLRDTRGCAVLVIDHDLHFVMNLCDRMYVLDAGQVIAAGTPDEIQSNPLVREAYLGSRGTDETPQSPQTGGVDIATRAY
jgi:branched-chain amino acid transport system permease protein